MEGGRRRCSPRDFLRASPSPGQDAVSEGPSGHTLRDSVIHWALERGTLGLCARVYAFASAVGRGRVAFGFP